MSDGKGKSSTGILVLSVFCALLAGFIIGYFTANFQASRVVRQACAPVSPRPTRSDNGPGFSEKKYVIYFSPGNREIFEELGEIPSGNGRIRGKIFLDDRPMAGLEFSLILARGMKTQKTTVLADGSYEISIPQGKYYFNGLLIYEKNDALEGRILVNVVSKEENVAAFREDENASLLKKYSQLKAKIGSQEAAKKLSDTFGQSNPSRDEFLFTVSNTPFTMDDFNFRKPIEIIIPINNSMISLKELKVVWSPVKNASTYSVRFNRIDKDGPNTSYSPAFSMSDIKENQIDASDIKNRNDQAESGDCGIRSRLLPGKVYSVRVIAFDNKNSIITSSSLEILHELEFMLKE